MDSPGALCRCAKSGPAAPQNLQEVEISFLPYARVDGSAQVDLVLSRDTAGALTLTSGYMPTGLTAIAYDATDDLVEITGAGADWPTSWEPGTITIDTAGHVAFDI